MRTLLHNESETAEMVIRLQVSSTDFTFYPLPPLGIFVTPPVVETTSMSTPELVVNVHVRTLTGTGTLRIITFFSE